MAKYDYYGTATSLFDVYSGQIKQNLLYQSSSEFGLKNADGSVTYVVGSGFVWNATTGKFTGGTVTGIAHYTAQGAFTDSLQYLNLSVASVQSAFEAAAASRDAFRQFFLSGNDEIDVRHRANNAVVATNLTGYAGDDIMRGGMGADSFFGGGGKDKLYGNDGNDFLNGGLDDDSVYGGYNGDRLVGDGGADLLSGGDGDDFIYAGAGNDTQMGDSGIDTAVYQRLLSELIITINPTTFNVIEPNGQDNLLSIERLATDDGIFVRDFGTGKWVQLSNRPGISYIYPEQYLVLTNSNDTINLSGTGKTIVMGLNGDDRIAGAAGYDTLIGGTGNDVLTGDIVGQTVSNDRLIGQDGNDVMLGNAGDDLLYGGNGNDRMLGDEGDDRLWGDAGYDVLTGGAGADRFVFTDDTNGRDVVTDWTHGVDKLSIDASAFGGGLYPGVLAANRLVSGAAPAANQATGQFLYSTTTGILSWDADGTGSGIAQQIAWLKLGTAVPMLTASDFLIVV